MGDMFLFWFIKPFAEFFGMVAFVLILYGILKLIYGK